MSEPIVIDKYTYKIMKYLYRHEGVSTEVILKKYGSKGFVSVVHLVGSKLACVRYDEQYSYTINETVPSFYFLTINGNAYVENRRTSSFRWLLTTFISLIALSVSICALFL